MERVNSSLADEVVTSCSCKVILFDFSAAVTTGVPPAIFNSALEVNTSLPADNVMYVKLPASVAFSFNNMILPKWFIVKLRLEPVGDTASEAK